MPSASQNPKHSSKTIAVDDCRSGGGTGRPCHGLPVLRTRQVSTHEDPCESQVHVFPLFCLTFFNEVNLLTIT